MYSRKLFSITLIALCLLFNTEKADSVEILTGNIDKSIIAGGEGEAEQPFWIFFNDDGGKGRKSRALSQRALSRIADRSPGSGKLIEVKAVSRKHIQMIMPYVIRLRNVSDYFNAVSADVAHSGVDEISQLDFVQRIEPVAVYRRNRMTVEREKDTEKIFRHPQFTRYGESLEQLEILQATDLLEEGVNGSGQIRGLDPVRICLLDSGFDLDHEAFEALDVITQRDFIQNDSITSNQDGDSPSQDRHGTLVLGAIAGYMEGSLVGPAYGAEYILGKTEIVDQEIIIEEDYWIAGLEWADSAGADIVSSSLGYYQWYEKSDMDGRTALCSQAAAKAASLGMLVVTAAGNNGFNGDTTLIAPADADSILAVGSVSSTGIVAYNSSRGPSADGRIKPEVVAMGVNVYSVDPGTWSGYARFSGTSLATPLVAGVCAQVLELNPYISVLELRDRITGTATRSSNPDNSYGYGIVQGAAAAGINMAEDDADISLRFLGSNPFREMIRFEIYSPYWSELSIKVFDCRGRLVKTLLEYEVIKYAVRLEWDGTDGSGNRADAGVYFLSVFRGNSSVTRRKLVLIR